MPSAKDPLQGVSQSNRNHHNRTEFPNIISLLKLTPQEKSVYWALKQTAGDGGICFKSSSTLAEESGVDIKTYRKCKKSLSKIFPLINKPLIHITERKKENKDNETSLIEIVDIWDENQEYFLSIKKKDLSLDPTSKNGGTPPTPPTTKNGGTLPPFLVVKQDHINNIDPSYIDKSKGSISPELGKVSAIAEEIVNFFIKSIRKKDPKFKTPNLQRWGLEIDRIMKIDGRSAEEIYLAIQTVEDDDFENQTVLSPSNLRKSFTRLAIKHKAKLQKDVVRNNRNWVIEVKKNYPKELKDLKYDDKYVMHKAQGKEISFNMNHDAFVRAFTATFGGRCE